MNELQKYQNHEVALPEHTQELLAAIIEQGTAPNTLKAHKKDLEKFWIWAKVVLGIEEHYPVGTNIIISEATLRGLGDRGVVRNLGAVQVKGIEKEINIYSLSGIKSISK